MLIGIDCATDAAKVGLARATYQGLRGNLLDAQPGDEGLVRRVVRWIGAARGPVLLALDAPLGWTRPLARALTTHRAGQPLPGQRNVLFRRATDRDVFSRLRKRPLDVGADRIARTAHWALEFLEALRNETRQDINLAWRLDPLEKVSAIEVYPAATLVAHHIKATEYKRADDRDARRSILDRLPQVEGIERYRPKLVADANVLDAVVCVVAGIDFLEGRAERPADQELAEHEGWIWVSGLLRDPEPRG